MTKKTIYCLFRGSGWKIDSIFSRNTYRNVRAPGFRFNRLGVRLIEIEE
jgi:hypothetical protein